jgi:hypothetical protein
MVSLPGERSAFILIDMIERDATQRTPKQCGSPQYPVAVRSNNNPLPASQKEGPVKK